MQPTTLDIINTMLGVAECNSTSEEAKKLAKEIIDRKVKQMYDLMIQNEAAKLGIVS